MPSIPQSLLWISLVVLWLFVLVPMLINKRDTVKRTSDVALATRVLNGAAGSRLLRRSRPAAGHRHDPLWQRDDSDFDDDFHDSDGEAEDYDEAVRAAVHEAARARTRTQSVMAVAVRETVREESEAITAPVYLDVDVVDETSGALPVGEQATLFDAPQEPVAPEPETVDEVQPEPVIDEAAEEADAEEPRAEEPYAGDEYEYVDDTSGLEASEAGEEILDEVRSHASRRRRLESTATAAAVSARKYRFRKRMLTAMAAVMVLTAGLSLTVDPSLWWTCGAAAGVTILYLAYLRRQTRIEEQIRRRRQQRMTRTRAGEEAFVDGGVEGVVGAGRGAGVRGAGARGAGRDSDGVSARLQRPGAVVLDIDDEDPIFEHLDEMPYSRRYDLPRAAGQ